MAWKYIIFFNLLIAVNSTPTNSAEVYEKQDEALKENIRVPRNPKLNHFPVAPNFDFRKTIQQDPQRIRYAQQQEIDSYMRAYHQEQATKRPQKHRKQERITPTRDSFAKTTYDNRVKSENQQQVPKQLNFNLGSQLPKKVDPIHVSDISPQESILKKSVAEKTNPKLGYLVTEDLDGEASSKHESRVYFGQEQILKTIETVPTPLSPNYLAKPSYVLANPQLNQLLLDPKLLSDGAAYAVPYAGLPGFEPASKTDLEALSSLLGQSPNAQLHGLSELLNHQQTYAPSATDTAVPEIQQVQVQVEPQSVIGVKDHTPIKEELIDVANTHTTPQNAVTPIPEAQISHNVVNHELTLSREPKSIYADHDDNLQYAAQYAFGYKIRDFHSGNNFGHEEIREGDVAKGHYHVLLPDGRLQNVEYYADPSGYHATVTYSNLAHH